jgi:hypothetical protein
MEANLKIVGFSAASEVKKPNGTAATYQWTLSTFVPS